MNIVLATLLVLACSSAPKGHLKPFGSWGEPLHVDSIYENISPKQFHEHYLHKHEPVIFKAVECNSAAFRRWTPEYLKLNYGDIDVKLEPKIENRNDESSYSDVFTFQNGRTNIAHVIENSNKQIYAVTILPHSMSHDVNLVPATLCGSRKFPTYYPHPHGHEWMTHILEVNLWLSFGRTRSQLHYDKENAINCLYSGTKEWYFVDTRKYHSTLQWVRGNRFNDENDLLNQGTDWVDIDPDRVDLMKYKEFQKMQYYKVKQEAGDCLFIPYAMLHYVDKITPGFSAATTYMWEPGARYDEVACESAPFPVNHPPTIPLAYIDTLWWYSGKGVIPQGQPEVGDLWQLLKICKSMECLELILRSDESFRINSERQLEYFANRLKVEGASLELTLEIACAFEDDMLSCNKGHRYYPRSPEIWSEIKHGLKILLKKNTKNDDFCTRLQESEIENLRQPRN